MREPSSGGVRTVALPASLLKRWDAIAVAQLCQRAAELEQENEDLQRRLRWAEGIADRWHPSQDNNTAAERCTSRALA